MRRSRRYSVGLLAAGLWLAGRAAPAQQIPVGLGGVPTSFVGLPFDVPVEVNLSGRSDLLGSFALTIRWNPAVLAFVKGQDGNFGALTTNVDSAGGLIRLTGANPGGVGGHVVVGVGRFVPLVSAADTFKINVTELYAARTFADLLPSAVWANKPFCPAVGRYGDIDGNGVANSADALAALTYAVGKSITGNPLVGDVDGDGLTGARDALVILAYAVGLDVTGFRMLAPSAGGCGVAPGRLPLALVPGNVTLDLAQRARYTAVATDSTGSAVAVTDLSWASSDTAVAKVDSAGVVTALTAGVATIRVMRLAGDTAAATVTVMQRHTHWVDALASPESQDQLGAPELPFRTIPQAVAYADPGDTVRVRSGRYDDTLVIDRPIVIIGDTTGPTLRPLLSAYWLGSAGITVRTAGRVELRALRVDTLTVGVAVEKVDTLLVRWMEFRTPSQSYQAALFVDTAGVVMVRRSAFFGPGNQYYYANSGIVVDHAAVVSIDSIYVAEYGYDAITLYDVDSVSVRWSRIRDNYQHGVYYCPQCYSGTGAGHAVFSGNRFTQNSNGHVYVDNAQTVRFDHNRALATGSYYDGYTIYGDTATTLVTLLGDSLVTEDYGYGLYLSDFDSLAVDSTVVLVGNGYNHIEGGRVVSVRDSRFLEVTGDALDIYSNYPSAPDSTKVLLQRVEFRGPDSASCDRCGYMMYGNYLNVTADSIAMTNVDYGFDLNNSRLALRHALFQTYWYGISVDCGSVNLAQASLTSGYYGVRAYGCGAADSAVVDSVTFANNLDYALSASYTGAMLVSRSAFTNNTYAIYHDCGELRVTNVTASGGSYGVEAYGCNAADTLVVDQSSFSQFSTGVYLSTGTSTMQNSVFTDDDYGVYLAYTPGLVSANQFVRPRSYGLYHYWYSGATGATRVLNNTVSCDAYGAGNATGFYLYRPYPTSDTVTATGNSVGNCQTGIYVTGGRRSVIRSNSIALPTSVNGNDGIWVDADSSTEVVGNTVSGFAIGGSIFVNTVVSARADSNTITNAVAAGLLFPGPFDTLLVRDNSVDGLIYRCCSVVPSGAIQVSGSGASSKVAEIRRNRIANVTNGILLQRGSGDTLTVQVDSNAIRGADSIGIWLRYYSRARIRYNAIDSSGVDAVRLSDNYLALPAAVLDSNNLTHSKAYGVNNLSVYTADATDNWWGDAKGPTCVSSVGCDTTSTGDSVSTYVTFNPFLTAPFSTLAPAPRLVASAPSAAAAPMAAGGVAAPIRTWAPVSAPPQRARVRSRAPLTAASPDQAVPAATSANPVVRRLEAVSRMEADRVVRQQAEQARLQELREEQRAAKQQGQVARDQRVKPTPSAPRPQ